MSVDQKEDTCLALYGGKPVRQSILPYSLHRIEEEDIRSVVEVLRSEWLTTGPKVTEFEEAFAASVGARYAVSFSSGTAALQAACCAAGLEPGDEVITTPMAFCAAANAVLCQGARPVFADVSPDTLNIDPEEVSRRITPRTKAILPVDYAGHPADLKVLLDLSGRHGLIVIEDAAHALGAEWRGRRVGGLSHMTTFSFHPVKHITTGEGGMVTTQSPEVAKRLQLFRNHGIDRDFHRRQAEGTWIYDVVALGFNHRLSDVGCALGLSQLARLPENLRRRRRIAARYTAAFLKLEGFMVPSVRQEVNPAWHLYPIRIDEKVMGVTRPEFFRALRAEGIGANVHFIPVHLHSSYRRRFGYQGGEYPVAEAAYRSLISVPIFHGMSDHDVEDVIQAIEKVAGYYALKPRTSGVAAT